ncbi:MAG: SDR family NAD(P)-dependent oxidoreductase [Desulfobacterales bacterium]|nr:SDR family NAD(P)-dependent oxidoreductase [Desulfobacterales bacterium]
MDDNQSSDYSSEDIAVIGMAGRFPKSKNLDEFWQNLRQGTECISFFSDEELQETGVDPAVINSPNFINARAILEDPAMFDASFFGMNPREAELTDPQHRVFLECAWESLENAGYDPGKYQGMIGVYAGADVNSYALSNMMFAPIWALALIGNDKDYLATRVSFKLNLKGPGITIQTACSTSLAAVQVACQGLLGYQCDMALAGGVGIAFPQKAGYWYEQGSILSPDGHCRAFDAKAQGTPGGDGLGIVVLKRYEDAVEDGDFIHAVIKGSALNNDGSLKVGFTAPSIEGQAEAIAMAQAAAEVDPETITYVEAHGTGTELGDPVEVAALTEVFRSGTDKKQFCAIGSLKTNMGHMNSASGIGGLMKTILALKHKMIPPSLNFEHPNPKINIEESPFYVNTETREWELGETPRRAGVSSFGAGGTNAHVILEEAPPPEDSGTSRAWQLLVLSAKTETALDTSTTNLAEYFKKNPGSNLANVAYTLQRGRQLFEHRRMLVCQDTEEAIAILENHDPRRIVSVTQKPRNTSTVFMFPGQGAQYVGMAEELYKAETTFSKEIDFCAEYLKPQLGLDLRDLFYPDDGKTEEAESRLNQTAIAQPALFSMEYALARLWMSWGVSPGAMIGHSIGEYVAACLAGVFSLEHALTLTATRGQLMQEMPGGSMLAVPIPEEEARKYQQVSVAAVNAPSMCVLSGASDAIEEIERQFLEKDIACQKLHTSHAFHSDMMLPVMDEFRAAVRKAELHPPRIPYISNVTGTWISAAEATDPGYWARHIRQPVRFAAGITELLEEPDRVLLEVGPGSTLTSLVKKNSAQARERVVLTSIRHPREKEPDLRFLLSTLGRLCFSDVPIDWAGFYAEENRHRIPLPTYPFERELYWLEHGERFKEAHSPQGLPGKNPKVAEWLYVPSWKRSIAPPGIQPHKDAEPQCWVVFAYESDLCLEIVKQLNQDVITVTPGKEFNKLTESHYTLNPKSDDDYDMLLEDIFTQGRTPQKIVHMWNLTHDSAWSAEKEFFEKSKYLGFYSLLFLAKALGKQTLADPIRIEVLTSEMCEVTGEEQVCPEKSLVLGPCRVIPQEFPKINCRNIDLVLPEPGNGHDRLVNLISGELASNTAETMVAYRGKHRWTETFEPVHTDGDPEDKARLRDWGVYLITGGLGGIGLTLGEYLARAVRARLVLTGRSGLPPKEEWNSWLDSHNVLDKISRRIRKVQELEALGAEVLVLSADVADEKQMQEVINVTMQRFGEINGVIHGAGIVGQDIFRAIQDSDPDQCELQFRPKIQGLYTLAKVLPKDLDFCLLLSSLSTVIGGVGLAAYAGANNFMDAYARRQNQENGVPWISVNWDRWAPSDNDDAAVAAMAQLAILPEEGAEAFQRILFLNPGAQVAVSIMDLKTSIEHWIKLDPLRGDEQRDPAARHTRPNLDNEYVAPRDEIEQTLAEFWQELLGIDKIGVYDNFFQLGGDSLLAIQLSTRLRDGFQIDISVNNLFDEPTIADLAEKIRNFLESGQKNITEKLDMIESLSDEQVKKMLAELGK